MSYPVLDILPQLKAALQQHPLVILQAPPGAGKSTVLPLHLLNESWLAGRKIIMLEPRRLATKSVAHRLAVLSEEEVGKTIGYRIRFEAAVSAHTKIEVVTEGILTRMIQANNSLDDVGLVIFDEFHERNLQSDLALSLCLQVQQVLREDLRILIMSATLDADRISSALGSVPVIISEGKQYPVTIHYHHDPDLILPLNVVRVVKKALREQQGDILVFLPGVGEINRVLTMLEEEPVGAVVYPLYGDLPLHKQQEAILPDKSGRRKVVLSTSIAETSLTIEGISTVIDSGLARVPKFDPRSGLTKLETVKVTLDAANQRTGRAGRLGPGVCYRLWNENTNHHLVPHRKPEILEADLAPFLLELIAWGVKDISELQWVTPPPAGSINQAKELLGSLDAIQSNVITSRGLEMVKLPTHPRLAHMFIEASSIHNDQERKKMIALAADIAALMEERDPLSKEGGADVSLRVEVLRRWRGGERVSADRNVLERIERLAKNWRSIFKVAADNAIVADKEVGSLISLAYPDRIARQLERHSERYKLVNNRIVKLPPHDALTKEAWLAVAQLDAGEGEGKIFLAAPIDESDLITRAKDVEIVAWDEERSMLRAARETRVGNLVLKSKPLDSITEEARVKVLCKTIRNKGFKLLAWSEDVDALQSRMMSIRLWRPEEEWPDVSNEHLMQTLEEWLAPYLINVTKQSELQRLDLKMILSGVIPWHLQSKLDLIAPNRLPVPSGSSIAVSYFKDGRPPVMEVRLQEVFGMLETPTVNEGRTKIIMHLLSPGFRPVQVTQDLHSFWENTYAEVRKELRNRYPKHHWPEDPWTAEAVRGVKRKNSSK